MASSQDIRERPQLEGDDLTFPSRIRAVPFDPDREAWERQSAERMIYYKWFITFLEQETKGRERSVDEAFRKVKPDSSRIRFREIARIWSWERRAELFDEHVFRNNREAYFFEVAKLAARQAHVGIVAAGMGAAVLKEFTAQLRDKINEGRLTWDETIKLLPIGLRAVEIGQREERLARGFQRAIANPEPTDDDFSRVVDHFTNVSGPEVDSAFRQLEEVLVERVTIRRTTSLGPETSSIESYALPSPRLDEPHYPGLPEFEDESDPEPRVSKSQERLTHESKAKTHIREADQQRAWVRDNEIELTENDLVPQGAYGDSSTNVPLLAEQRMRQLREGLPPSIEEEDSDDESESTGLRPF